MKRLAWPLGLTFTAAVLAAGLPSMRPLVDHLRTLPASVTGEVFVKSTIPVMDNDEARVSIRPDRNISFHVSENGFNVDLTGALNMCVKTVVDLNDGCLQMNVTNVRWTPEEGFKAEVQSASYDVFGYAAGETREKLEEILNTRYAVKMNQALEQVRRIRESKDLGQLQNVAQTLGNIFTEGAEGGQNIEFGGRVGINFTQPYEDPPTPSRDHAVLIGDNRLGIAYDDRITARTNFYKNADGLHLQRFELLRDKGINFNQGREFAQDLRVVLHRLSVDASGTDATLHLGASETIAGLAALIELVGQAGGAPPSQDCVLCELAELPVFTSEADLLLRTQVRNMVRDHRAELIAYGVSADTIDQFLQIEECRINGMSCQIPCAISDAAEACVASCMDTYRMCMQTH
jgi:hypothetical protein